MGAPLDAAAGGSAALAPAALPRKELSAWLRALPAAEKVRLLLRVAADGDARVGPELVQRFQTSRRPPAARRKAAPGRTVARLLDAAGIRVEEP